MTTPEIQELIRLVQETYGRPLNTTSDFDMFSLHLKRRGLDAVSTSTLKRLWGYVRDERRPRVLTLDTLARYAGHADFAHFVEWLKTSTYYNSSFFTARQVSSAMLHPGDRLEIGWAPNRLIMLEYTGDNRYRVIESHNSKMQPDDRFLAGGFIIGYPLYLPFIEREGTQTSPFIAGRNGGLTTLNVKSGI